jgi:hypothetical protein
MVKCPSGGDEFKDLTGHGGRYVDDVRSWQTSEPAIDMTGTAIIGAALQQATAKPGNGGGNGTGTGKGSGKGGNDYTVSVSARTATVARGRSTTLTVTADGAQSGPLVALTATGMPEGVLIGLAPAAVVFGRPAKMTISALTTAVPGTYTITITGTGLNLKPHAATVKLTVA